MRRFLAILGVSTLLAIASAYAQTARPQDLLNELNTPASGARVTVAMSPELSTVLNRPRSMEGETVDAYRVYIYNDNSQNARSAAQQTRSRFQGAFPDVPSEISYENPYWKVAVGNCLTKDEAMIVFGRVKGTFPSAFVRMERLPLKNFLRSAVSAASEAVTE